MTRARGLRAPNRPTKLTEEVERSIILAISAGAPLRVAAGQAGIHPSTLMEWMAKAAEGDRRYADFSDKVRVAQDKIHTRIVGTITTAALRDHSAALAWIRLRWPEMYAERHEVTGAGGSPLMSGVILANVVVNVIEAMGLDEAKVVLAKRLVAEEMRKIAMSEGALALPGGDG